jgi:hypothetical protein
MTRPRFDLPLQAATQIPTSPWWSFRSMARQGRPLNCNKEDIYISSLLETINLSGKVKAGRIENIDMQYFTCFNDIFIMRRLFLYIPHSFLIRPNLKIPPLQNGINQTNYSLNMFKAFSS